MSETTEHVYFTLEQIDKMRDACHTRELRYDSLGRRLRDELAVVLSADLGLRPSELLSLKEEYLDLENEEITLPGNIQKDYPIKNYSPSTTHMSFDILNNFDTVRILRNYLNSDWYNSKETEYLFPTRQTDKMRLQSLGKLVKEIAKAAEIEPKIASRDAFRVGKAEDAHTHAFRHSVANYMLKNDEIRLIDVRDRLRHRRTSTTENVYEHFKRR